MGGRTIAVGCKPGAAVVAAATERGTRACGLGLMAAVDIPFNPDYQSFLRSAHRLEA